MNTLLIRVSEETKKVLDDLKIIKRESYNDLIKRLIKGVERTS